MNYLCDIMTYNTKYIFGLYPTSGTELLKPLVFPKTIKVALVTFGKHLSVGSGCQEKRPRDQRVGPASLCPPPASGAGTEAGSGAQSSMANDLNNFVYVMKPP